MIWCHCEEAFRPTKQSPEVCRACGDCFVARSSLLAMTVLEILSIVSDRAKLPGAFAVCARRIIAACVECGVVAASAQAVHGQDAEDLPLSRVTRWCHNKHYPLPPNTTVFDLAVLHRGQKIIY
jgi:hypothetical protein